MEGTVVVDFANDVNGIASSIGRDMYCGYRLVRLVDSHFRCAYLWLLPPKEGETVAVRVIRL